MPNYHQYLIASLPYLNFGAPAPMGFARFLELAQDFIPQREFAVLKNCADILKEPCKASGIANTWRDFESSLRNELVKIRAKRLHKDAEKYLRNYSEAELSFIHKLNEITRSPHSLDAERALDLLRWNKLDELCFGHYFDIELLFIYAQKLLILIRWDKAHAAQKEKVLNNIVNSIEQPV
ncbi:MAG: DUF2764 family protein [Candidatus Omnitrophica bacterium]|nr:DUF2764 family protein [Candidatus Omnitrophota bacterium]